MEMSIIPTEKLDSFQADLTEIKGLLNEKKLQADLNRWFPKKEARTKLDVCMKTLDNYLAKGIIPYSRFAGKVYIKASDIEAHLEKNYITK
jgi:hypothetical protein